MHWQTFYWIAGGILALAWFSRIVEAALGMPHVANIARPEWDRRPAAPNGEPGVSIIVPARNEEESIRETLVQMLATAPRTARARSWRRLRRVLNPRVY